MRHETGREALGLFAFARRFQLLAAGVFLASLAFAAPAFAACGAGTSITGGQCRVFLTTGTSWTVPSDWTSTNAVECIGGGGGGAGTSGGHHAGGGGGGGEYRKVVNVSLTAGAAISYSIGGGGAGAPAGANGSNGSNTVFNSSVCVAHGGGRGVVSATDYANFVGGAGGSGGSGGTGYNGGQGGPVVSYNTHSAGGGAGGPNGVGGAGGRPGTLAGDAGAGGGAGGGGGAGSNSSGSTGSNGGAGSGGSGAGGRGGDAGGSTGSAGTAGGAGTEWDATHGSGGGGGSGGFGSSTGGTAGAGGLYGGGGAAGGYDYAFNVGGAAGAQGIIVITYTPVSSVAYGYDAQSRLTCAAYSDGTYAAYTYDPADNRVHKVVSTTACATDGSDSGTGSNPVAANDNFTTPFNTAYAAPVLGNDTDPTGYSLSISSATSPSHGSVSVSGPQVIYTPTTGYSGGDSFTYTISNGHGGTATATVLMTVASSGGTNHAPVANADSYSTAFNTAVNFNPRLNDSDPDSDPLAITAVTSPSHGSASIVSGATITYTPTTGYSGSDSFNYTISDGRGGTASAAVSITVSPATNHAPVAVNDSGSVRVNQSTTVHPLTNDTDADGDTLTITDVTSASDDYSITGGGTTVTVANSGGLTEPSATYTISDGHGGTASATISMTVIPH